MCTHRCSRFNSWSAETVPLPIEIVWGRESFAAPRGEPWLRTRACVTTVSLNMLCHCLKLFLDCFPFLIVSCSVYESCVRSCTCHFLKLYFITNFHVRSIIMWPLYKILTLKGGSSYTPCVLHVFAIYLSTYMQFHLAPIWVNMRRGGGYC